MPAAMSLVDEIRGVSWYHTLELHDGIVTPGRWDTRGAVRCIPFPRSLAGMRCLDVGTWDGFWAFEMERRGATEVVAIDLDDVEQWDWPASAPSKLVGHFREGKSEDAAFFIAHRALGSRVERLGLSVYDLSPEAVGRFDFVFIGTLLLHLRDPVRALSAIRQVLTGELLAADQISLTLSLLQPFRPTAYLDGSAHPHWWTPNIAGLKRLVSSAGFEIARSGGPYFLKPGPRGAAPRSGDFSSGTTLVFTLFRNTEGCHCLYEPLHERLLHWLVWPPRAYELGRLLAGQVVYGASRL